MKAMFTFKSLFGQEPDQIKRTCLLTPFLAKGLIRDLGVKEFIKAMPFSSGNSQHFTLIHTQIGAPYVGDAVLYLKETRCKNIILFGACGLVQRTSDLNIGSLVIPHQCYAMESFSRLLIGKNKPKLISQADKTLLHQLEKSAPLHSIPRVKAATMGSLYLEKKYYDYFRKENIDVADMECSAFFNAAKHIRRKAVALFYVTDILKEKPLFTPLSTKDSTHITAAVKKASGILLDVTAQL